MWTLFYYKCLRAGRDQPIDQVGSAWPPVYPESEAEAVCWETGDPWVSLNYQDPRFQVTGRCLRQTSSLVVSHAPIMPTQSYINIMGTC